MSEIGPQPAEFASNTPPSFATEAPARSAPSIRLFDSTSVLMATLFGSPLAGGAVMALNYRRLGKPSSARWAFLIGILATAAAVFVGFKFTPPFWISTPIAVGLVLATKQVAETFQGGAIVAHATSGGMLSSRWAALGIGILGCATVYIAALALSLGAAIRSKVIIGTKDQVYYGGSATKQDAAALGAALKSEGYLRDNGFIVILVKDTTGATVSFVVDPKKITQPDTVDAFVQVLGNAAASTIGLPVKLRFTNLATQTLKVIPVGRITIGANDLIYYAGSATQADANALAQALQAAEFLQDRGVRIFLNKDDTGTSLAFIVKDGVWSQPATVAAFEQLVRGTASSIGGLPVRMELLSVEMVLQKDEILH
ncbi:MAG TPA: hypothetical protein VFO34_02200 [Candidatus Acidoferrales bacterium]|nr:hypothetical protein [Candidatus Acidoferrales bacterium]